MFGLTCGATYMNLSKHLKKEINKLDEINLKKNVFKSDIIEADLILTLPSKLKFKLIQRERKIKGPICRRKK